MPILTKVSNIPTVELSTPDRPSGPLLEEQFIVPSVSETATNQDIVRSAYEIQQSSESIYDQSILSNELVVAEINPNIELSTPDRPSGPLLEEQFSAPLPNNLSLDTNVNEVDAEVADFIANNECDSSEDITVYEVVTEYQATSTVPATNYPRIFLQLCEGQIINVESGEVVISLSQFVAPSEASEPGEIENNL